MRPHRKTPNRFRRWLRRNFVPLFLIAIILISMGVGVIIGHALSADAKSPSVPSSNVDTETLVFTESVAEPMEEPITYWDVPLSEDLQDYMRMLCEKYAVPEELVLAMIDVESSFRHDIVSASNDYGLMQINKVNHNQLTQKLGVTNFLDPYQNILCGVHIISEHLEKTDGDISKALMRYNCGATGALRLWQQGIYSTSYTERVVSAYEFYKEKSRPDGATS